MVSFDALGLIVSRNTIVGTNDGAAVGVSVCNFNERGGIAVVQGNVIRNLLPKRPTGTAPARIHGGRAAVRSILYMAAVTASKHNPVLRPSTSVSSPRASHPKPPSLKLRQAQRHNPGEALA